MEINMDADRAAERYRWLRKQDSESKIRVFVDDGGRRVQRCFDDLDDAIDAEMDGTAKNAEAVAGAIAGIDVIDSLLSEAGYQADSSTRHQLSIVRSILTANLLIDTLKK